MLAFDNTFGAMFDGMTIATALYGITCGQTIAYYRAYPDDLEYLKVLVALLWVNDTLQQIFVFHAGWYYLVTKCGRNLIACTSSNWSIVAQIVPSELSTAIVEFFFILRIYKLGQSKFALILGILPCVAFAFCMAYVAKCFRLPEFRFATQDQWVVYVFALAHAANDIVIAITMCYFLWKHKNRGFLPTRSLVSSLMHWTITTGLLTSIVTWSYFVLYIAFPLDMWYIGLYITHSKFYVNSMLAVLNSRKRLRGRAITQVYGSG